MAGLGLAVVVALGVAGFQALQSPDLGAIGYIEYPVARPVAFDAWAITDHRGQAVTAAALAGRWSIVFFGFTYCPDVCPVTLSVLNRAIADLPEPPRVMLVSLDPKRDTPARLGDYLAAFNPDYVGLTGRARDIQNLADALGMAFVRIPGLTRGDYSYDHAIDLVVLDPSAAHAGYIKTQDPEALRQIFQSLAGR
jgi:protein SCO1/2